MKNMRNIFFRWNRRFNNNINNSSKRGSSLAAGGQQQQQQFKVKQILLPPTSITPKINTSSHQQLHQEQQQQQVKKLPQRGLDINMADRRCITCGLGTYGNKWFNTEDRIGMLCTRCYAKVYNERKKKEKEEYRKNHLLNKFS